MRKKITKANLVLEIAEKSKLNKAQVSRVLKNLSEIAYREASNGFIVPGICKLSIVRRKERRCRIPSTGQMILIGEHDALKVVPVGAAKNAVAPKSKRSITILENEPKSKISNNSSSITKNQKVSEEENDPTSGSQTPPTTELDEGSIVFACSECGSMISAPSDSAGKNAECPFCNTEVSIPSKTEQIPASKDTSESDEHTTVNGFMTFFCGECGQEIESSKSMAGLVASCPTCGSKVNIPDASETQNINIPNDNENESPSMTMRIDLLDLE